MSENSEMLARIDERTEQILASLQELKSRSDREDIKTVILALQPVVWCSSARLPMRMGRR